MSCLGFCDVSGLIFEGPGFRGTHPVQPSPFLLPIRFSENEGSAEIPPLATIYSNYPETIFREDSFDPVSKIRRGRVFTAKGLGQPMTWFIYQHPLGNTGSQKQLVSYQHDSLHWIAERRRLDRFPQVILGGSQNISLWKIVAIEDSVSRTPVLTLKALSTLGEFPEIKSSEIPPELRKPLTESIEKVLASINLNSAVERAFRALKLLRSRDQCRWSPFDISTAAQLSGATR